MQREIVLRNFRRIFAVPFAKWIVIVLEVLDVFAILQKFEDVSETCQHVSNVILWVDFIM